jgi:tetratricopeptide (TPR) repeat protein
LGNYDRAKRLLEDGLLLYKTHVPENHLGIARTLGYLGNVHKELGDYTKAQAYLEKTKRYYIPLCLQATLFRI